MAERSSQQQTTEKHDLAGEDRLSALPDDLLLPILIAAELDILTAVQTSLLSTRWRSLWKSCLRSLRFQATVAGEKPHHRFGALVRNTLSGRDIDSPLSLLSVTITANPSSDEWADLVDQIYAYGRAHRVPIFRFAGDRISSARPVSIPSFSTQFASLCASVRSLDLSLILFEFYELISQSSNFPALASLRLHHCIIWLHPCCHEYDAAYYDGEYSPFASLPNLEKLELSDCEFMSLNDNPVKVSGNNLVEIAIAFSDDHGAPHPSIIVSAPRCRYLACRGVYLEKFSSAELPALDCLDMDCRLRDYEKDESFVLAISGLQSFGNAECVKLRPNTIKALTFVPGRLERQTSPFKRVKRVELCGTVKTRREFNALMSYFFDDYIRGPTLFHRISSSQGMLVGGNSGPVIVCKSDWLSCKLAGSDDDELAKNISTKLSLASQDYISRKRKENIYGRLTIMCWFVFIVVVNL